MSTVTPEELARHRAAIGRSRRLTQNIDPTSLARFGAATGSVTPPLVHWAFFHDVVPDTQIGPDGHPLRGDFLPAVEHLPRRMFAGSEMVFHLPMVIGLDATLDLEISDLRLKHGRSGDLLFVEVDRRLAQDGALRIFERQTLVYLPASSAVKQSSGETSPVPATEVEHEPVEDWVPHEVNLFRFSAATFNGHRIHYDREYAIGVENYPDLVVHGPFIASKLAGIASRRGALAAFSFRAGAPCFVGRPIRLMEPEPGTLQAIRDDGITAMTAKATYQ